MGVWTGVVGVDRLRSWDAKGACVGWVKSAERAGQAEIRFRWAWFGTGGWWVVVGAS